MNQRKRTHTRRTVMGMLALLLTLPAAIASPPPFAEALRFATEGRADVSTLQLSCGRSAKVTIAALAELTSPKPRGQGMPTSLVVHRDPVRSDANVFRVIEIPKNARGTLRFRYETDDPMILRSVVGANDFLISVVGTRWLPKSEIRIRALARGEQRAYASGLGGLASIHLQPGTLDIATAIHELAHHIEGDHRFVLEVAKLFLARRARGGTPERLRDLTGLAYKPDEVTLRANWATRGGKHYIGKFYGPSLPKAQATELISMGLERLHREPAAFFREDADYFLFLLLVLQGGH